MGTDYTLQQPTDSSLQEALDDVLGPGRLRPGTVFAPADSDEVQRVVQTAHRYHAAVSVGHQAIPGVLTLSVDKLDGVRELDGISGLVTVEAGCSFDQLGDLLKQEGLRLPQGHFGPQHTTVGASIMDGEGGPLIVSTGGVLPDGMVFSTPMAPRRATGPNPDAILTGSRNRLAIVLWVTLRTEPYREPTEQLAFAGDAATVVHTTRALLVERPHDAVVSIRKGKRGRATATWQTYRAEDGARVRSHYESAQLDSVAVQSTRPGRGRPRPALWSDILGVMEGTENSGVWCGPLDRHGGWIRKAKPTKTHEDPLLKRVVDVLDPLRTLGGQAHE